MSIVLASESCAGLWRELEPLMREHYRELAVDKDIPLCPDTERYEALEQADVLRGYTARREGELIGYAAFFVQRHLHYATSVHASQDVLFLRQDYRRGGLGLRLIAYCERRLAAEGVDVVHHHAKPDTSLAGILARKGYRLQDLIYSKRLR